MTTKPKDRALVRGDWRWEPTIGLCYGYYKGAMTTVVHRPTMLSPWWTIAADDNADFVRIFSNPIAALEAAEVAYGSAQAFAAETETTYEVWERNVKSGRLTRRHPGERGHEKSTAEMIARSHNKDEVSLGYIEQRPVQREYVVVKATTKFEVES